MFTVVIRLRSEVKLFLEYIFYFHSCFYGNLVTSLVKCNSCFLQTSRDEQFITMFDFLSVLCIYINITPISKTRPLSSYQSTHDKVMQAWTSDIHTAAWQEPTGGPVFILYSTQSSSYIYRYTVLIRDYDYIAIYT